MTRTVSRHSLQDYTISALVHSDGRNSTQAYLPTLSLSLKVANKVPLKKDKKRSTQFTQLSNRSESCILKNLADIPVQLQSEAYVADSLTTLLPNEGTIIHNPKWTFNLQFPDPDFKVKYGINLNPGVEVPENIIRRSFKKGRPLLAHEATDRILTGLAMFFFFNLTMKSATYL